MKIVIDWVGLVLQFSNDEQLLIRRLARALHKYRNDFHYTFAGSAKEMVTEIFVCRYPLRFRFQTRSNRQGSREDDYIVSSPLYPLNLDTFERDDVRNSILIEFLTRFVYQKSKYQGQ